MDEHDFYCNGIRKEEPKMVFMSKTDMDEDKIDRQVVNEALVDAFNDYDHPIVHDAIMDIRNKLGLDR